MGSTADIWRTMPHGGSQLAGEQCRSARQRQPLLIRARTQHTIRILTVLTVAGQCPVMVRARADASALLSRGHTNRTTINILQATFHSRAKKRAKVKAVFSTEDGPRKIQYSHCPLQTFHISLMATSFRNTYKPDPVSEKTKMRHSPPCCVKIQRINYSSAPRLDRYYTRRYGKAAAYSQIKSISL